MLQSLLIQHDTSSPETSPPFHPDFNNWSFGRPKIMSHHERKETASSYHEAPSNIMPDSLAPRHAYETPRSYGPSSMPAAAAELPELQPWLFQIFPDPYVPVTASVEYSDSMQHNHHHTQYMYGGDGGAVYDRENTYDGDISPLGAFRPPSMQ